MVLQWPVTGWTLTYFRFASTLVRMVQNCLSPYIYWAVHHLDSWIKRDHLDVTCIIISFFNAQHVSDVNTYILRNLRLICWVISWVVLFWFDVCWCYVVVWLGWCCIRMQAEALLMDIAWSWFLIYICYAPPHSRSAWIMSSDLAVVNIFFSYVIINLKGKG